MTAEELIAFEADIAREYDAGHIRAPVHLAGGDAERLLEIFSEWREGDYTFSTWRSHWHALLSGVPAEKVRAAIMAGRSITLCFPEHRFYSSAIVAGCCPIALGVAMRLKMTGAKERVWCCIGDMAAETGLFYECAKYAGFRDLPIRWIIEDNGLSVCTDTRDAWFGIKDQPLTYRQVFWNRETDIVRYVLPYPHSGAGKRVNF